MSNRIDPTWARFGAELRRLRVLAGRNQDDIARTVTLSKPMISALERGTRTPKADIASALDAALSTGGTLRRLWRELSDTREVPDWFRDALLIERRAREIHEYEPLVVPGLLQTEDYAGTLIRAWHLHGSPQETEQLVKARTERLAAILENNALVRFVIREAALTRVVGSNRIMKEQLAKIARLAENRTVRMQVLPDTPEGTGMCLPFRLCMLNETQSVAFVDNALGGETHEAPEIVSELTTIFDELQSEALCVSASLDFILKLEGDM